jgi:hypothetical protein
MLCGRPGCPTRCGYLSAEFIKIVNLFKNSAHLQELVDTFCKVGMPEKPPGATPKHQYVTRRSHYAALFKYCNGRRKKIHWLQTNNDNDKNTEISHDFSLLSVVEWISLPSG